MQKYKTKLKKQVKKNGKTMFIPFYQIDLLKFQCIYAIIQAEFISVFFFFLNAFNLTDGMSFQFENPLSESVIKIKNRR